MFFGEKSKKDDFKSTDYKYLFEIMLNLVRRKPKETMMQSILANPSHRFLLLAVMLLICALVIIVPSAQHFADSPSLWEGYILKTAPPEEVAIELSDAQLVELEAAFENGFDNPEPNDPCQRLRLLPYKKLSTWRKQFGRRGFTMEKIRDMLANGRREAFTHPEKGLTYTKIFDPRGNWIVVDFVDCIVWQVAPYNFK